MRFLAPLFQDKHITLKDLSEAASTLISQELGHELLQNIITYLVAEHGPQFVRDLWININWSDFIRNKSVTDFISKNVCTL